MLRSCGGTHASYANENDPFYLKPENLRQTFEEAVLGASAFSFTGTGVITGDGTLVGSAAWTFSTAGVISQV